MRCIPIITTRSAEPRYSGAGTTDWLHGKKVRAWRNVVEIQYGGLLRSRFGYPPALHSSGGLQGTGLRRPAHSAFNLRVAQRDGWLDRAVVARRSSRSYETNWNARRITVDGGGPLIRRTAMAVPSREVHMVSYFGCCSALGQMFPGMPDAGRMR